MAHQHIYNSQGKQLCCTQEEKIYSIANAEYLLKEKTIEHEKHEHNHDEHEHIKLSIWQQYLPAILSFLMLMLCIVLDNYIKPTFFNNYLRIISYLIAYLLVGFPVIKEAFYAIKKGDFFTEFTLMVLATVGAFAIGEYAEGVAVMLFYAIGELFQSAAVNRAKNNIKALLDIRPTSANVKKEGTFQSVKPETVEIGAVIQVKAGEKVPLDSIMLSEKSSFNTAALTGESRPKTINKGETVLAGMLNLDTVIELSVTKKFSDSSLARILDMVQNATSKKAQTELLIRKFAKIYTPIVFFLAIALIIIPYFIITPYIFNEWLYRALVFLVISCPCALVISIPLGYFGGIGAASRQGILFKGSNYLDLMTQINTIVMDKTGTLTEGIFEVQEIQTTINKEEFLQMLSAIESQSTHPIAKAITKYTKDISNPLQATEVQEIAGHGLKGIVNGKQILAGNIKLFQKFNIIYDKKLDSIEETIVIVSIDNQYTGYVLIADKIKEDAMTAIKEMQQCGINQTVMLSGDKNTITQKVAKVLGIDIAFGDLLPQDKVQKLTNLKQDKTKIIAFVGDGINDAPVLALSDVGIAMGAIGSDAAIETANVVIQTDQPSKIVTAIKIGKATKKIVIQNILLAFTVKIFVLILGAGGLATMWEAVFADVGVAIIAIFNAVRIQNMKF